MTALLITSIASFCGAVVGAAVVAKWTLRGIGTARLEADRLQRGGQSQTAELHAAAQRRAELSVQQARRTTSATLRATREHLSDSEQELDQREHLIESRHQEMNRLHESLETIGQDERGRAETLKALRRRSREMSRDRVYALEARSSMNRKELLAQLIADRISRSELEAQMLVRQVEGQFQTNRLPEARRILAAVVDRYAGVSHLERLPSAVAITDPETLDTLSNQESAAHQAFVEAAGCELSRDPEQPNLTVRGDDPFAREVARRALRQMANRCEHHPDEVRNIISCMRGEVEREALNAARKATRSARIGKVHPNILELLGRLKFRLSYSQNQWKHALEVSYLAGLMAEELGLDAELARRSGLLHDIGKAMTHDHDGSHAVLGAKVARDCGEHEVVANSIGSHHGDEPARTPIALLVAAADALSGARPGARRETTDQYVERIREIQYIASRAPGVERVDIMHAGREVRIVVATDVRGEVEGDAASQSPLSDDDLLPLATQVARNLERELTFAGQIRVTVIRESRSVAVAR